jgi:hypothetical protein
MCFLQNLRVTGNVCFGSVAVVQEFTRGATYGQKQPFRTMGFVSVIIS